MRPGVEPSGARNPHFCDGVGCKQCSPSPARLWTTPNHIRLLRQCPAPANWIVPVGLNDGFRLTPSWLSDILCLFVTFFKKSCKWHSAVLSRSCSLHLLGLQDYNALRSIRTSLLWKYHSEANVLYSCWLLICIMYRPIQLWENHELNTLVHYAFMLLERLELVGENWAVCYPRMCSITL